MLLVTHSHNDKEVARLFLRDHGVFLPESSDFNAIGRMTADNRLLGVVAYNGFCGKSCSMHVAGIGPNWVNRELLRAAFAYPFEQCKLNHLVGVVAADNAAALRFNRHLGFEVLFRIPHGWSDTVDTVIMGMSRQSCRWLTKVKKQEQENELQAA